MTHYAEHCNLMMRTPQSTEPPVPVTEASKALAAWYVDPLNRFYRYPLCNVVVRPLLRTPLTPDHISLLHVSVAMLSAWYVVRGSAHDLVVAALLYELRNILDCLDGVLARARKTSSLHGAVIDEIADSLGFTALLIACGYHIYFNGGGMTAFPLTLVVFILSVLMAMNYVLQKNRFHAPLATGINEVELKLHERWHDVTLRPDAFMPRFVWFIEKWQNAISIPGQFGRLMGSVRDGLPLDRRETEYLIRKANDPWLKMLMVLMSIATGEYVILILQTGLLMNHVEGSLWAIVIFAPVMFIATTVLGNLYLTKAYR